ncbi:MAG TPA: twin-arginine translocase TatA/TatE family subunit [Gemmatimonadales bacterium]|nr:twin-arginine translocase TatA/TatE family subunit [Gemmatimonadales bacterium]
MGNFGFWELMAIAAVVLLVFGAKRLPEIGASMGKGIREFQRSLKDTQDAVLKGEDTAPRMLDGSDSANTGAPTGGEPKRLSQ